MVGGNFLGRPVCKPKKPALSDCYDELIRHQHETEGTNIA